MNTFNKIISEMTEKKISKAEICQKLGIGTQAFTDWKSGKSKSYMKYLPQIAKILEISVSSLLNEKEEQKEKDPLLEGIIEYYSACDIVGRSDIYQYAKQKAEEQRDKKTS